METDIQTILRRDIRQYTEDHDGEMIAGWEWDEVRLTKAEVMTVRAGELPSGMEWDADLRRIERSALLDRADVLLAEASDHADNPAWQTYAAEVHEYKIAVRASKELPGFPEAVVYPDLPVQPKGA